MPESVTLDGVAAVIIALGGLVMAIGTVVNGIITARANRKADLKTDQVLQKATTIEEKATTIEKTTNGAVTAAAARERALHDKVDRQRVEMAEFIADRLLERLAAQESARADVRSVLEAKAPDKATEPK